ncbi:hypothetical protein FB567DRAFT_514110 [Paraphoma chrysanthemicola]|uniref:N-acetyltransferase domain-containing protein n=1 Tax=Paraphoma chrysanthemicola TaxID=798071 RepID=A0A8K0W6B6_9PLEO|nr:hypothetical protein FB567DRAFT_514110 [Paraphoma chrysanthemicola]
MPLELHPVAPPDALAWARIRAIAYYGPTHDVLHSGPIRESSIRGVAEDRARALAKPNLWHWKVIDTDLSPSEDDPPDNGGRTIAVSAWSMHNVKEKGEESDDSASTPAVPAPPKKREEIQSFLPPELRIDALRSLFDPLRAAQEEIMGAKDTYFMLNSLATHPDHRGRGAATLLLDWGMKKADEEGVVTYLDATGIGKGLYEKTGFVVRQVLEWDRKPWGGEGVDCHYCMTRQPRRL